MGRMWKVVGRGEGERGKVKVRRTYKEEKGRMIM